MSERPSRPDDLRPILELVWDGTPGRVLAKLLCRLAVEEGVWIDSVAAGRGGRYRSSPSAARVLLGGSGSEFVLEADDREPRVQVRVPAGDEADLRPQLRPLLRAALSACIPDEMELRVRPVGRDAAATGQVGPGPEPSAESVRLRVRRQSRRVRPLEVFRDALPDGSYGPDMVVVPPGRFLMGSAPDEQGRLDNEGPQHPVSIARAFAIGRYVVTLGQFRHFAETAGYPPAAKVGNDKLDLRRWLYPEFEQTDAHPVVLVSWRDAMAYADWLSAQTGQRYRLPSEAEWEYAARAGTRGADSFGDVSVTASAADSARGTVAVGTLPANPWGLHETLGNVAEWCADCLHPDYASAPVDGSAWVEEAGRECEQYVIRGGSWASRRVELRLARREWNAPDARSNSVGFRLARDLSPGARGETQAVP